MYCLLTTLCPRPAKKCRRTPWRRCCRPRPRETELVIVDKERILLKIFHDYYVRNLSQSEIAERHFISRQKVQRYLEQGRRENLVEVRIKFPSRIHGALESEIEDKFGLLEVIVADPAEGNLSMLRREIADFAADYFLRVVSPGMFVDVCWSTFIAEMADMLARKTEPGGKLSDLDVIQSFGSASATGPGDLAMDSPRKLAAALGARLHLIMAPGIAASVDARRALLADPRIAATLEMARRADAAFFGIGSISGESNIIGNISRVMPGFPAKMKKLGVVGDINGCLFDRFGNPVESELDKRLIGLSLSELRGLPLTVGVTGGPDKFEALYAAVVGRLVKTVVTDLDNARRLADAEPPPTRAERAGKRKGG